MQGPEDEGVTPRDAVRVDERTPARPYGGKAMLRLLELLKAQGLTNFAQEAVATAVTDEVAAEALAHAEAIGALPPASPQGDARASRLRASGRPPTAGGGAEDEGTPADIAAPEDLARTYAAVAEGLAGPPTAGEPQWRSVGPSTVTNGQTYGSSRVNVSGRVSALAVDPSSPAHVLAGGANGGVWESRDRGASWQPRTDFASTLTVGAIAFDPSRAATVYCGLGEGDWWSLLGNGVLRSSDGGTSWSSVCTTPFVGQGFYALRVDPADGNRLFGAATGGLYVSTDAGTTWTQRRSQRTFAVSLGTSEVLASCADGLFRSTDSGTTWTAVNLPGAPAGFVRLAVAVAPSNPNVAYAFGTGTPWIPQPDGSQIPTGYLWRRAAGVWTAIGLPPGLATVQSWYDWYVAVAPDLDTQVYCGAIELHRGDLSGATWSWQTISNKGSSGQSIHPDQHSIAFEPGNPATVYAGCDGGLFRSPDRGTTWVSCNNGLVISEFEYLAQDWGSSRWLIGGTQDNGTNRWTGPSAWEHVEDADGGDVHVNRQNPSIVIHSRQWGGLLRSTSRGDWGSWTTVTPTRPAGEGRGLFYPPLEGSATSGDTVAVAMQALYVSRDNASTWTRVGFPSAGIGTALAVPDPDTVLVGLGDGRILRTRFSSGAWGALTALTTPRAGAVISDLAAEPGGTGRLWATSSTRGGGRVWRSDDGGTNWTDRTGTLPGLPVNAIAVDDGNRNRVWVAADLGVYQSFDGGASWTDFSASLPNAFVGDLVFHPHARVLRAGTRNRGVWEIPVDGWMTQPWCGVQWTGTLAANASSRWFTFNWPATWHVLWTAMPTSPAPGSPQISFKTQVERADAEHVTYWITVRNLTGQPVTFEGRFCVLSRY
ncbi:MULTISPECIES: WD40/YVTN/BNR-like repeat-containing protein [unclassified Frankia]|uniref:WD40/YVTN/BNR-like repeat-containing protein n=1 Tax=unclassified Frankia TaxID=2632575 RepID=UPI002025AC6B